VSDFDDEPTETTADRGDAAERTTRRSRQEAAPGGADRAGSLDDDWDDDWDDEDDRGGGRRDLTLVYAVVAAAIVIVLAVVLTRPSDDDTTASTPAGESAATSEQPAEIVKNWQGPVGDAVGENGADAQERAGEAPGVYIWTDFEGWHIRSNRTDEVVVTIAASQVRQKASDDYDNSNDDADAPFLTEVTVTLPPGDGSTGAGFDLGGSEAATFTVTANGQNVPATEIFLGGGDAAADANPVVFTKA
jgi:hypothetical protein